MPICQISESLEQHLVAPGRTISSSFSIIIHNRFRILAIWDLFQELFVTVIAAATLMEILSIFWLANISLERHNSGT